MFNDLGVYGTPGPVKRREPYNPTEAMRAMEKFVMYRVFQKNRHLSIFWRKFFSPKWLFRGNFMREIDCKHPEAWKRFLKPVLWKILFLGILYMFLSAFFMKQVKKAFSRFGSAWNRFLT
jgi:hypothetical protein